MTSEAIHVRRLRLEARRHIAPVALAARFEDALRCASLPAGWRGRVVLIRRLRLRADGRVSPQQLARQIGAQWQMAAARAVPAARAPAHSDAVWFDDEPAARLLLIARLARGADVSAWFWQRLLPPCSDAAVEARIAAVWAMPWQAPVSADESLRFAAEALCEIGDLERIAAVLQRLDDAALERLFPGAARVQQAERNDAVAVAAAADAPRGPPSGSRAASHASIARCEESSSIRRAAWRFAVAALAGQAPARSGRSPPAGERAVAMAPEAISSTQPGPPVRTPALSSTVPMQVPGLPSDWAGTFFVLNLWQQAQCAPASHAEAHAWLRALAQRLRVAENDGLWPALAALGAPATHEAPAPVPWAALRRACLAGTRLPLRRALARRGRIDVTRTHLTIYLPLHAVDLRLRRAGFDLDPGWSPLLGRIVRFEYD